jgi:hypothetical protein
LIELFFKRCQGHILTETGVCPERHTHVREKPDLGIQDIPRQTAISNLIPEHPTGFPACFKDGHTESHATEEIGRSQSRRPRTDHGGFSRVGYRWLFGGLLQSVITHITLQSVDVYGVIDITAGTARFAGMMA